MFGPWQYVDAVVHPSSLHEIIHKMLRRQINYFLQNMEVKEIPMKM